MSGSNPFRHRKPAEDSTSQSGSGHTDDDIVRAGHRFPSLTVETPPARASPKPKTVRIASPPVPISPEESISSPTSPHFIRRSSHSGSPPPPEPDSSSSEDPSPVDPTDPFHAGSSDGDENQDDEEVLRNTRRNSALTSSHNPHQQNESSDPVKTTLARFANRSRPPSSDGQGFTTPTSISGAGKPGGGKGKASLDVDAFKRLLMTGDTGLPSSAAPPTPPAPHSQGVVSDSSSNTDTASVSRQSIFEPMPPLQTDTPRTSHEMSTSDADDERQRLVGETPTVEGRKKPTPQKARYGKLIKSNPIQAVSSPYSASSTAAEQHSSSSLSTSSPMQLNFATTADLNKPLPPRPIDESFPSMTEEPLESQDEGSISSPSFNKRPPTPPLSRRQSHRSSKPPLPRSNSSRLSLALASGTGPSNPTSSGSPMPKTPPPPPRRQDQSPRTTSLDTNMSTYPFPPASNSTAEASSENAPPRSRPPAPPSRTSSLSSVKRVSRAPTSQISGNMPPPPPPPRRVRGSDRSSFDSTRPVIARDTDSTRSSGEYRRASGESSRNVSNSSNANDILAELSALQKEVDHLRGQHESREAS